MARAWIETHYKPAENRTEWRVVVDGAIEGCGATIEPTADVATFAVVWNGSRWH